MMFRKGVSAKQITTSVKKGKTRGRLLLTKSSVTTFKLNNTSGRDRKHQPSKNCRISDENDARSLLDVGTPSKHQVTTCECFLSQHQPLEIEPTLSSEMRKPGRPLRLFSTPTRKDLESTERKGVFYSGQSKKLQRCSEIELLTRDEMSNIFHEKLSKLQNHFFSMSDIETYDNKQAEEDKQNSKHKTFAENFSLRSSSQHQPPFIFSSPPRSQIVTHSQIIANPPGAPRALFREKSKSHVPSPVNLRKQAHLSSSELDDTSMEKESSDTDEGNFAVLCRKLEF